MNAVRDGEDGSGVMFGLAGSSAVGHGFGTGDVPSCICEAGMYLILIFYHFYFYLSSSLFTFVSWFSISTLPHVCIYEYMK